MASDQQRMKRALKGVNIGGWLVLEKWITPSLFASSDAADEYTFCQQPDARAKLKRFRNSFVTEQDFAWLAANGVQAVRLPIGYWLFGDEPPYVKTCQYVDMVFKWAIRYDLKVLLSLHGLPGSQNGKDHSGKSGVVDWPLQPDYIPHSLHVLERIARRYGQNPALLGVSLANETAPHISSQWLEDYYNQARASMEPHCHDAVLYVFSDSFKPRRWYNRLTTAGYAVDHHQYQIFTSLDRRLPVRWQVLRARFVLPLIVWRMARRHPVIVGEWSGVLPDRGKSYDGAQRYISLQQAAFDRHALACFYWTYKTEAGGLWDYRESVTTGVIE